MGATEWWPTWLARDFKRVRNLDQWLSTMDSLNELMSIYMVSFLHVKAHTNIWQNELADRLAKSGAASQ